MAEQSYVCGWLQEWHVPNSRLGDGSIQQRAESSVQPFHAVMLDRLFHAVTCRTTVSTSHTSVRSNTLTVAHIWVEGKSSCVGFLSPVCFGADRRAAAAAVLL